MARRPCPTLPARRPAGRGRRRCSMPGSKHGTYEARAARTLLLAAALLLPAAAGAAGAPAAEAVEPERLFDWNLGTWKGVRKNAEEGTEAPMILWANRVLGGAAQTREIEIRHSGGVYRGFSVLALDRDAGTWVEQYLNDVQRRFVRLEGEIEQDGARSIWRSAAPDRGRQSRLVSERLDRDTWRRTMSVSEDGGETWRVLWIDELTRGRGF